MNRIHHAAWRTLGAWRKPIWAGRFCRAAHTGERRLAGDVGSAVRQTCRGRSVLVMRIVNARDGRKGRSVADAIDPAHNTALMALNGRREDQTKKLKDPHQA